jgi:predicted NACHT family NTPase
MKADLIKRLFKAIFSEDIVSLKKIAYIIISEERDLGHGKLASSLENISATEKPRFSVMSDRFNHRSSTSGVTVLPTSKRNNAPLVSFVPREQLKHHMALPQDVEERLLSIEKEFVAKERLGKYNLLPKRKILLHGAPGCGKTMSAERIAWNLGLPLLKVRFDTLLSS